MRQHGFVQILKLSVVILFVPVIFCAAADHEPQLPAAGSGKKQLLLFAKNPSDWSIVKGGASGSLTYGQSTGAFTLTAAGLQPHSAYALIRLADAPPKAEILLRGSSDGNGRLKLSGVWRNWSRKFWLVSGEDVAGNAGGVGALRAWRPNRYLFEEKLLGIACSCPEAEEPE